MKRSLLATGVVLAAVVAAAPARAQGSAVMTHSSCATAMGSAGVAAPCEDGSAVLYNPAALAGQPSVLGIGITGITTSGDFTYDTGESIERDAETSPVPFGFLNYRVSDRLAAGIGAFAPYGLQIAWPVCPVGDPRGCEQNFEGRYVGYDNALRNIYIQPTLAYQLSPRISVGAGLDVVLASIEINQRLDLATTATGQTNPVTGQPITFGNLGVPRGTDFADANLTGDGTAVTFHLGAQARVTDQISVGVRYLHEAEIDYEGDADFTPVATGLTLPPDNPFGAPPDTPVDALVASQFTSGALADQGVETGLTLPSQLVVGVALTPVPALKLLADYQLTTWESFDTAQIAFQGSAPDAPLILDYQDAHTLRLGAEYAAGEALDLRAGFIYNTAAEKEFSVSPLLPEAERNYYSAGLGYRIGDAVTLDLGYQLVDQSDRRGRVRGRDAGLTDAQLRALNVGVYTADAHVFNATLSYRFGSWR